MEASLDVSERRRLRKLRRASDSHSLPPTVEPRDLPFRIYVSIRWFSAAIIVVLLITLVLFLNNGAFFIKEIYVGGTRYLTPPEIFQRSELANMHIFWVEPSVIETRLESDPAVANATVEIGWPPNMVQITITEREPAMVWVQAGQRVWVDVNGRVMYLRKDLPDLVTVMVEQTSQNFRLGECPLQGTNELLGPDSCIDQETVTGVLQFKQLYSNVREMVYDPIKGLGYHDERGWVLWFGDGRDMVTKIALYNKIVETTYVQEGIQLIEVNVSNPDEGAYYIPVIR